MAKTSRNMKRNARKTSRRSDEPRRELPLSTRTTPVLSTEELFEAARMTPEEAAAFEKLSEMGSAGITPEERALLKAKGLYYPSVSSPSEQGKRPELAIYQTGVTKEEGEAASRLIAEQRLAREASAQAARAGTKYTEDELIDLYITEWLASPFADKVLKIGRDHSAEARAKEVKRLKEMLAEKRFLRGQEARSMPRPEEPGEGASREEWRAYAEALRRWSDVQKAVSPVKTRLFQPSGRAPWPEQTSVTAAMMIPPSILVERMDPLADAMRTALVQSEIGQLAIRSIDAIREAQARGPLYLAALVRKPLRPDSALAKEMNEYLASGQPPLPQLSDEELAAVKAYENEMREIRARAIPTEQELQASRLRELEKVRAGYYDTVPKKLQTEVKSRELAILGKENVIREQIALARKMLRESIADGTFGPEKAAEEREKIREKEQTLLGQINRARMELEMWWRGQIGEPERPIWFPELHKDEPYRVVAFGEREAALERATGTAEKLPEVIEIMADAVADAVTQEVQTTGAAQTDEEFEAIGARLRRAATRDMEKERQDLSRLVARGKITPEERDERWQKISTLHKLAVERLAAVERFARDARAIRKDYNPAALTDRELGVAEASRDPKAKLAMAGRFTKELRGLYEYIEIEDPRTGELLKTRMPKIDEEGNPIWEGYLTRYAGHSDYTGAFNVKKMRVGRTVAGTFERMEAAERQFERAEQDRQRAKRVFAQFVVDYNRYTKKEREQKVTAELAGKMNTPQRDEAAIKFFIREYGFQLPEWSKLRGAPRATRSMPTAEWTREYGLPPPRVQNEESKTLQLAKERRERKHRAIVKKYKTSRKP